MTRDLVPIAVDIRRDRAIAREQHLADLAVHLVDLRGFYPEGSDIRALIEELIADLTDGALRPESEAAANRLAERLDPDSTAARSVRHVLEELERSA